MLRTSAGGGAPGAAAAGLHSMSSALAAPASGVRADAARAASHARPRACARTADGRVAERAPRQALHREALCCA